jgi:hypothetical protein
MTDDRGRDHIYLGAGSDNAPLLTLWTLGRRSVEISADPMGHASVDLYGPDHLLAARLYADPKLHSGLSLHRDEDSYVMGISPAGQPSLSHNRWHETPRELVLTPARSKKAGPSPSPDLDG